jgi:cytochrome c peroxidase
MKGLGLAAAGLAGLLAIGGCDAVCGDDQCIFTKAEWDVAQSLGPLPDPETMKDATNRFDGNPAAIALGHALFFEKRYSKALRVASHLGAVGDAGKVACTTCHDPNGGFSDTKSVPNNMSLGVSWTTRNTPSLVNTVYYKNVHGWDLRQDSLWNQGTTTPETGTNSAGDRCDYAHMLFNFYREQYDAIFEEPLPEDLTTRFPKACRPNPAMPGNWEKMSPEDKAVINRIMVNQGKAVAAYESQLVSRNAPFDRYITGEDRNALSLREKNGLKLFIGKASCVDCHNTPFFSDLKAHNLGVPQLGPNVPAEDLGFFGGISQFRANSYRADSGFSDNVDLGKERNAWLLDRMPEDADKGKFRTQTLRNLTQSAPYMHTGGLDTLRRVVEFYNEGGGRVNFAGSKDPKIRPLLLTDEEIDDLVAFLQTLTGEAIPGKYRAAPAPFVPPAPPGQ